MLLLLPGQLPLLLLVSHWLDERLGTRNSLEDERVRGAGDEGESGGIWGEERPEGGEVRCSWDARWLNGICCCSWCA